jgi:hypothetical protein
MKNEMKFHQTFCKFPIGYRVKTSKKALDGQSLPEGPE